MSDPEVAAVAREWMRYAHDDLHAAETLLEHDVPPRIVCFLAQQAAEKAIKSLLIGHQIRVRRIHDLVELARALPAEVQLGVDDETLANLGVWAIGPRYPGDVVEATAADGERAVATARSVVAATTGVLAELGNESAEA